MLNTPLLSDIKNFLYRKHWLLCSRLEWVAWDPSASLRMTSWSEGGFFRHTGVGQYLAICREVPAFAGMTMW